MKKVSKQRAESIALTGKMIELCAKIQEVEVGCEIEIACELETLIAEIPVQPIFSNRYCAPKEDARSPSHQSGLVALSVIYIIRNEASYMLSHNRRGDSIASIALPRAAQDVTFAAVSEGLAMLGAFISVQIAAVKKTYLDIEFGNA